MAVWARNGVVAGLLAFITTLVGNSLILIVAPADLCRMGPLIIPLGMLGALFLFVLLAAVAGYATGRAGRFRNDALLSGLVVGAISGCAVVVLIPLMPALMNRVQELTARCPRAGGSVFFGSTPPPGVSLTPPPGAFGGFGPPSGIAGSIFDAVGAAFSIAIGLALSAGVATLAGMAGAAGRRATG